MQRSCHAVWSMTIAIALCFACDSVRADSVVATRTIRPQSVIAPGDVDLVPEDIEGAATDLADVVGRQARVAIYQGGALGPSMLAEPTAIERNQTVSLLYQRRGLAIQVDGRALGRGSIGDRIKAMNMQSKVMVEGVIAADGTLRVD